MKRAPFPFQTLMHWYQRRRKRERLFLWVIALVLLFLAVPGIRRLSSVPFYGQPKATLYFDNPPASVPVGSTFTADLRLHSDTAINAVGTVIQFNPRYVEVTRMTTEQSFCSFYAENAFDNIKGEVHVSCGTPNPGFTGDSIVAEVEMRVKTLGTVTITTSADSQILANNGKGTNLLQDHPTLTLISKQQL